MASMKMMTMMIMAVLSVVLMSSTTTTQAQDIAGQTCIQALFPCLPYLESPNPSPICCDPLKEAVRTQLPCLCAVLSNPGLGATINMTQAMQLPLNCGMKDVGPSMCTKGAPTAPAPGPSASAPSSSSPSETTVTPPPLGNGAGKNIAYGGPVSGIMLALAGLIFY